MRKHGARLRLQQLGAQFAGAAKRLVEVARPGVGETQLTMLYTFDTA